MILKPKKNLGQNFLIDKNIMQKIVDCANISSKNEILEIGAGTGNLTEFIIKKNPKKIFLVERDQDLFDILRKKFENQLQVYNENILKFSRSNLLTNETIIFGNLPYNISSQILTKFILNTDNFKFKILVFMFQKELADRIIANVNSSNYGRLSILSYWKFNIEKKFDINPNSFYPKPKVKSTLLVFTKKEKIFELQNPHSLEKVTKIFFNQRRKKIKKQFNSLFKNNFKIINKLNINLNLRPQNLTPEIYFNLAQELENLRN